MSHSLCLCSEFPQRSRAVHHQHQLQTRAEIYYHTPSATLVSIFLGICSTYLVTAVHLLKRICGANIPEICTHISVLCKCIHTKGYCMHTSTKYPPIYPSLTMYSIEGCLVHTYSKYSHTSTYCVLNRNTNCKCLYFRYKENVPLYVLYVLLLLVCPRWSLSHQPTCTNDDLNIVILMRISAMQATHHLLY